MNICVLNGSPRGKYSTTMHTSLYLEKRYPVHRFQYVNIGTRINALEKDPGEAIAAMQSADLIIFSYPVYTFIAPSQLHRFIASLKAAGADLSGKFVTQITTSKHFYDVTAHRYIEDNCHDLGMKVIHGLSADMDDLTTQQGREDAESFFEYVLWCVNNDVHEPTSQKKTSALPVYMAALAPVEKKKGREVVVVADLREGDDRLRAMIDDFCAGFPYPCRLVNIAQYPFQGGCLGCGGRRHEGYDKHHVCAQGYLHPRAGCNLPVSRRGRKRNEQRSVKGKTPPNRERSGGVLRLPPVLFCRRRPVNCGD